MKLPYTPTFGKLEAGNKMCTVGYLFKELFGSTLADYSVYPDWALEKYTDTKISPQLSKALLEVSSINDGFPKDTYNNLRFKSKGINTKTLLSPDVNTPEEAFKLLPQVLSENKEELDSLGAKTAEALEKINSHMVYNNEVFKTGGLISSIEMINV